MTRRAIELIAFLAALLLAALAFHAWLASHDEQQRLQATLAAQKQLLDAADARERDRAATLNDTLTQIAKLKSATQSPEEILRDLQQYLSLPQPLTLANGSAARPSVASSQNAVAHASASASQYNRASSRDSVNPPNQSPQAAASSSQQGTAPSENLPTQPTAQSPAAPLALTASTSPPDASASPSAQIPAADLKPLFDYVQDCRACQAQLAAAKQNSSDDAAKIAALTRERDAAITASKGGTFWRQLRHNALWLAVGAGIGAAAAAAHR
jgi:hypothetical protein